MVKDMFDASFGERALTSVVLGAGLYMLWHCSPEVVALSIGALLVYILVTEWPLLLEQHHWSWWLLTPFYPIFPMVLLMVGGYHAAYRPLFLMLVILVALYDSVAYMAGKQWGCHQLFPATSPGKTWEGFFAGLCATILGVYLWPPASAILGSTSWYLCVLVGSGVASAATVGDLFESWLKRRAGLKDSGTLLPGHGGALDRIDGLLFVAIGAFLVEIVRYSFLIA